MMKEMKLKTVLIGSFLIVLISLFVYTLSNNTVGAVSLKKVSVLEMRNDRPSVVVQEPSNDMKTKEEFCKKVNGEFMRYGWYKIICKPDRWEVFDYTASGNPLIYQKFGFQDPRNTGPVNLLLCGVHGDETVSIYPCFHLVRHVLFDDPDVLKEVKLIIAPIVNPDGFFSRTRQNANGVDPNRNLPTKDWDRLAYKVWKQYKKDPRKFPGKKSGSEVESRLQVFLIDTYKPDKILSFHSPLGFLDFDGPGDRKHYNLEKVEHRARYLGMNMEANMNNYIKLVDFRFFPGSLGNYAGNERKIPTYTFEFGANNPLKGYVYWNIVKYALVKALKFSVYDGEMNPALAKVSVHDWDDNTSPTLVSHRQ